MKKTHLIYSLVLAFTVLYASLDLFAYIYEKNYKHALLYYNFDKIENHQIYDQTKNKNHAVVDNSLTLLLKRGIKNSSAVFNNHKMVVSNEKLLKSFSELTISLWIKPYSFAGQQTILAKHSLKNDVSFFSIEMVNNTPYLLLEGKNLSEATLKSATVDVDKWNYLVVTFSDEEVFFYINGKLISHIKYKRPVIYIKKAKLSVGSNLEGSSSFFYGELDELIILDKSLNAEEISKEYDKINYNYEIQEKVLTNINKCLVANYSFDEGKGKLLHNNIFPFNQVVLSKIFAANWNKDDLSAIIFPGNGESLRLKHNSKFKINNSFTILCSIKPFVLNRKTNLISKMNEEDDIILSLGVYKKRIMALINDGDRIQILKSKDIIKINKWQQIGVVVDIYGETLSLVLNGEIIDAKIRHYTPQLLDNLDFNVGGIAKKNFYGELRNIQIYNEALPEIALGNLMVKSKIFNISGKKKYDYSAQEKFQLYLLKLKQIDELLGINRKYNWKFNKEEYQNSLDEISNQFNLQKKTYDELIDKLIARYIKIDKKIQKLIIKRNKRLLKKNLKLYKKITTHIGRHMSVKEARQILKSLDSEKQHLISLNKK